MSGIIDRLKNTYEYGGIYEVLRKATFHYIYLVGGKVTRLTVQKKPYEYGIVKKPRKEKIVVSLTSFPARFDKIDLCLKSIILQTLKPDRIIVCLGSDTKKSDITRSMKRFEKYGVEYRIDQTQNLMPHKKYFYAMQEFPDAVIITADDDVIYPSNWLSSLYTSYKKYPHAISARRVHYISKKDGKLEPYDHWIDQYRKLKTPSMSLIAIGNGGVLYPPHCFNKTAFDTERIKRLCLRTDDLWLKCMEVLQSIPVVWVKNWLVDPATIDFAKNERLSDANIFTGKNDDILRELMNNLSLKDEMFFD